MICNTMVRLLVPGNVCQHCGRLTRRRKLCWSCSQKRSVRLAHTPTCRHTGHGLNARGKLPDQPTDAVPGSEDKLRVLEQRAARGERLDHPDDYRPGIHAELPEDMLDHLLHQPDHSARGRQNNLRMPRVFRVEHQ